MTDALTLAVPLVKQFEGCSLRAYLCPAGYWTVGYGNRFLGNGERVTGQTQLSQTEADNLLRFTLQKTQTQLRNAVKVPLTAPQEAALISLTYNIGIGRLHGSTLLRDLNNGDYKGAAREFLAWRKSNGIVLPGLARRREAEHALFLEGTA